MVLRGSQGLLARSRLSPLQDPALAAEIGQLLLGVGRSFEAYAVTGRNQTFDMPNLTVGLPRELFLERAGGAMVHFLTTHCEAGVLVLWELAEARRGDWRTPWLDCASKSV